MRSESPIDDIHDERNTLGGQWLTNRRPPLDDALPMLREALLVRGHRLAQYFADRDRHFRHRVLMAGVVIVGALIVAPLEEVERDATNKARADLIQNDPCPETLDTASSRCAAHRRCAIRMLSDIGKGIPARGAPVRGEWVEQVDFAKERSVTRCERPIFLLDVEDQDGTGQFKRFGTTHDTPLPDRGGAAKMTPVWPGNTR